MRKLWDKAGRYQRHARKKKLDVSDGGAAVHVDAVLAQLGVHDEEID